MNIGEKIKFRRRELGLTQEETCNGICSTTYLSKLENNKFSPPEDILNLICQRLDMAIEDVLLDDFSIHLATLRHQHKILENREIDEAKRHFDHHGDLHHHPNPHIQLGFKINLFEYEILKKQTSLAVKLKEELLEKESFLNEELRLWFLKALGLYEYTFGDLNHSSQHLYEAEAITQKNKTDDAHLQYFLGLVNTDLMMISRSIIHIKQALKLYDREVNFRKIMDCKIILAINYNKIEQHQTAETLFLQLAKQLDPKTDHSRLGLVYHNLGYIYSLLNQSDLSIDYYQKALAVKKRTEETYNTIYLLALEYKKRGDLDQCLGMCDTGLKNSAQEDLHYHYKIFILKASISSPEGFHSAVFIEKMETEIIPYYLKQGPAVASDCYSLLARIYMEQFKYKQAALSFEKALEVQNKRKELLY